MARTKQTARRSANYAPVFLGAIRFYDSPPSPPPSPPPPTIARKVRLWQNKRQPRNGPPFRTHYGSEEEPTFKERVAAWLRARAVWAARQRRAH
jgi:hypothetical protein